MRARARARVYVCEKGPHLGAFLRGIIPRREKPIKPAWHRFEGTGGFGLPPIPSPRWVQEGDRLLNV